MNRRTFCTSMLASGSAVAVAGLVPAEAADGEALEHGSAPPPVDLPQPDLVTVFLDSGQADLRPSPAGVWQSAKAEVHVTPGPRGLAVGLSAPGEGALRLRLRWHLDLSDARLFLGDHWERSYGDLEWRGEVPNRTMPWYFLTWNGRRTDGYGVATGPNAFCFWNADRSGITLWADVRNGGSGVLLGSRTLPVCEVRVRRGVADESPFAAAREFCRQLCTTPRLPHAPVYGTNDWYYSYGDSHPDSILRTTELIVSLSPSGQEPPWSVIDDGWAPGGPDSGTWGRGNERFGDMSAFAARLRATGAQPGIWFRPLLAAASRPNSVRLSRDPSYLDPTIPDVLAIVADDTRRLRAWGYRLIKHDYSSYDLLGRWGFEMGPWLTNDRWQFADRSLTTAEVVLRFYRTLRDAAGDALVIGCNTFSHLAAGLFDINRIGDDVSGRAWDRTRRMGVNTLAFRAPHHGAFYAADPDIAPVTSQHPWAKGRQWLQLLADSGMPLFVSPEIAAVSAEAKVALKDAFARAVGPSGGAEPRDWLETTCPRRWRLRGQEVTFDWSASEGPWPFRD